MAARHGSVAAIVRASDDIRPGVVSMAHCWGDAAGDDARLSDTGTNINRLVDNRYRAAKYSGIPRQSTIPVAIRKRAQEQRA